MEGSQKPKHETQMKYKNVAKSGQKKKEENPPPVQNKT